MLSPMPEHPEPSKPVWEIVTTVASRLPAWIHEEVFLEKPMITNDANVSKADPARAGVDRAAASGLPSE
jgi:hypothetical protein